MSVDHVLLAAFADELVKIAAEIPTGDLAKELAKRLATRKALTYAALLGGGVYAGRNVIPRKPEEGGFGAPPAF